MKMNERGLFFIGTSFFLSLTFIGFLLYPLGEIWWLAKVGFLVMYAIHFFRLNETYVKVAHKLLHFFIILFLFRKHALCVGFWCISLACFTFLAQRVAHPRDFHSQAPRKVFPDNPLQGCLRVLLCVGSQTVAHPSNTSSATSHSYITLFPYPTFPFPLCSTIHQLMFTNNPMCP